MQRVQDMEVQLSKEEAHRLSLEEKHRHAREALDHFRVAAKEQRDHDQRQFEQQMQFLQSELRTAKDALNTKQQELVRSHEDNARLSNELAHSRSDTHRLETEIRSLRAAKEQLGVAELNNQHLIEKLGEVEQREAASSKENRDKIERLQTALEASQKLETELATAKAVIATQEQILQRLAASAAGTGAGAKKRDNADAQEGLFEDRWE